MSNLKEDFQTHLLNDLQPIAQQQESFEQQNHLLKNSSLVQGNSFILDNYNMLSQQLVNNQNLNISDHTLLHQTKSTFHYDNQQEQQTHNMFKNHSLTKQSDDANAMANEQYKNSSKLQDQLLSSENDKLNPNQDGSDWTQNDAEISSFTIMEQQNSSSRSGLGRGRRKLLVENFIMGHRDHMLLGSKVISGLEKNIVSLPFRQPVDIQRFNITDYHQIVKQPMDLRTIKRKISSSSYQTIDQIYTDIQLIISNSMRYNEFNADFIRLTKNFQKSYYKIRRDCERNLRRLKMMEDKKKSDTFTVKDRKEPSLNLRQQKTISQPKHIHHVTAQFPTNEVQVASNFTFSELIKLAKRIKKLQPHQQIELFKKVDILDTMVVDIKLLSTKDIRILFKEVQRIQKLKQQMIRQQEKKQYSHLTMCSSEYGSKCAV